MAGHSKFKNIQHRKGAQDKKKAKIFTKLVREIITAAKLGGSDTESNPRLRSAIISARSKNLPKDRIDKALMQASDPSDLDNYFENRYEGFLPGGIAFIVETLTDNKNRTVAEVRSAFSKYGGNLAESGSVAFMFDRVGEIIFDSKVANLEEIFEVSVELQAKDVILDEEAHCYYIYTEPEDFSNCLEGLQKQYGETLDSEIIWKSQNNIIIDDEEIANKIFKMTDLLEESDDVQKVFGNYELADNLKAKFYS
ncbi:MAG: YebC/PmpR family DNA-binding transcriptional regulator [Rickettsiaceae bacterium]|nr:YebC/PmpR family DNA-binding transcriptional regulator [Rickettsiaceae bacterium]